MPWRMFSQLLTVYILIRQWRTRREAYITSGEKRARLMDEGYIEHFI